MYGRAARLSCRGGHAVHQAREWLVAKSSIGGDLQPQIPLRACGDAQNAQRRLGYLHANKHRHANASRNRDAGLILEHGNSLPGSVQVEREGPKPCSLVPRGGEIGSAGQTLTMGSRGAWRLSLMWC
jgi:hypothetical protein